MAAVDMVSSHLSAGKNRRPKSEPKAQIPARALDALPPEAVELVAAQLDQYDSARLALVSRAMYIACMPRLCHTVIVDPDYTHYTHYDQESYNSDGCTYINLVHSFRRLMQVQPPVHALHVIALPCPISLYDDHTAGAIATFFQTQVFLRELVWRPSTFQWQWLFGWVQPENLARLDISMAAKDAAAAATCGNETEESSASSLFRNLTHFRLGSTVLLFQFARIAGAGAQLRTLTIDRVLQTRVWPPATELAHTPASDLDMCTVRCILAVPRPHLVDLTLSGVFVAEADAARLGETVNLPQIRRLVLHRVAECGPREHDGFLLGVAKHFEQLRQLHLDFREGARDTVACALQLIATRAPVAALGLVVRVNNAKLTYNDAEYIYRAHAHAVTSFSRLCKLTLEVYQEFAFCDVLIPTPSILGHAISRSKKLKSLQLHAPAPTHVTEWLASLCNLRHLDVQEYCDLHELPNLVVGTNLVDPHAEAHILGQQHLQANPSLLSVRINDAILTREISNHAWHDKSSNRRFNLHISVR